MKGLFIGTTTIDLIYPLKQFPKEDSKTNVEDYLLTLGGPATNAAITFAVLGGEATLVSPIGKNQWTGYIIELLKKYRIKQIDLAINESFSPTISSILVNTLSGLRTVITSPGSIIHQHGLLSKIRIEDFDVCCLDGFHSDAALQIIRHRPASVPIVFDGGSYKNRTEEILAVTNFPIFSERFAPPDQTSIVEYMTALNRDTWAITKGANPIEIQEEGILSELPVRQTNAIDTLAAGDIFHGAFSYYILKSKLNFKVALAKSAEIASLSTEFLGPRAWEIKTRGFN